ncbi:polyadenylate binding protein [Phanerochaete sordida]|uniref:Polyadenylate binding protein n=1 Tax=Phanerochaete sordida TaxID=48140 RepID=A0A9P3GNB9_9APHY|nr:polyadenylate binding protein [Phanerochaete sordida]
MATEYQTQLDHTGRQPHPYLHEPVLYISGLPPHVTDQALATAFVSCAPFRPNIPRDGSNRPVSGTIEFKYIEKAEKALATLQGRPIPLLQPPVQLILSPYPSTTPPTPLPPPSAQPRLVKHLPPGYTESQLYDLFRPFGALSSVRTQVGFGKDTGLVEFWREEDARDAEEAMHCADVEGQNIAVQIYMPKKAGATMSEFNVAAPTFVPQGMIMPYPQLPQYAPPPRSPYQPPRSPLPLVHGPGQQVQFAPLAGPGASHSGLIDPCNLFIKNLDTSIDSNGLFSHFRQFGQIVSARVMRNEGGDSRGFGFVSYQSPDQASHAMHSMNGVVLGTKQLVVRLHEPKQLRQEKLAARFGGHNNHPRSHSGATSPAASEAGDTFSNWPSPSHRSMALGSPVMGHDRPDRARRGSGSYYQAALAGTLNLPMRYDDLAALSPVVRKEVISGELVRRIKSMDTVPSEDLDQIVDSISALSLSDVLTAIQDPERLAERVQHATTQLNIPKSSPTKPPSPSASQDSRQADALNAPASAPDHPSTPISMQASLSTPPRTESPSGSVPPTSEKERMAAAVAKLESAQVAELTELIMSLPKRERAMCLFNVEVLRAKIADAKMVLESDDGEEPAKPEPATPQAKRIAPSTEGSPQTPDLSSRGASAAASPAPTTPSAAGTYTVASLARMPAAEIIRLTHAPPADFPLQKPDPLVVKATNEFIDGLRDKPVQAQKQALGDKLWRVVKAFGVKGAPKLTITLLDQEDLRALAHLMNSYPQVLKEKTLFIQAAK